MLTQGQRSGSNQDIPGAHVGLEHVKQCISALEDERKNKQHTKLYKKCPESLKLLRVDTRIKAFEAAAKYNEVLRVQNADVLKAAGGVSGGYDLSGVLIF